MGGCEHCCNWSFEFPGAERLARCRIGGGCLLQSAIFSVLDPIGSAIIDFKDSVSNLINDYQDLASFVANIKQLANSTQNPFLGSLTTIENEQIGSPFIATNSVSIVNPQPQVSAKSTDYTLVNTNLPLSSIFNSSISPSGSNDVIDHYTIINTLQGPGELVVNNVVYTQPVLLNVTPAELQTA